MRRPLNPRYYTRDGQFKGASQEALARTKALHAQLAAEKEANRVATDAKEKAK